MQNFWHKKGPEYLYQVPFDVLLNQTTCEMKALQIYIQQCFHDEQGAQF